MGKFLSHVEGMVTICFGHARGFVKQSKNCLPGFVELISTTRSGVFRRRCKLDYGL